MPETEGGTVNDNPILLCYDGTEPSRRAIATAAALLGPRQAVVLDVGPVLTAAESVASISLPTSAAAFEEWNEAGSTTVAAEGATRAREAGFAAKPRAELSAPTWQGIVDVSEEIDAAVIVLGSRGLHGAHELFEGSISHEVAAHAHGPGLIVPPTP